MGSFNVACSVSNLSISSGTKVAFLPLLASSYRYRNYDKSLKIHKIEPTSSLIYPNCYFNPFSLPIIGEYNDYGSIENIIEDDNTKAIEKFFGITIQKFVNILSCDRSIYDSYGELFKAYAIHKAIISDYHVKFDESFLTRIGFKKTNDSLYKFEDFPYYVKLNEKGFELLFELTDNKFSHVHENDEYEPRKDLINIFEQQTGYILIVSKENQEKVKLIRELSGMFIHYDIYEELSNYTLKESHMAKTYVPENTLEELGFTLINEEDEIKVFDKEEAEYLVQKDGNTLSILNSNKKVIHNYIYNAELFRDKWNELTGEHLDISHLYKISKYDVQFDSFKEWLSKNENHEDRFIKVVREKLEDPETDEDKKEELRKVLQSMLEVNNDKPKIDNHEFGQFYKDWDFFRELYLEPISKGKLKELFKTYKGFYWSMYSCNRFFFPAMNGEQYGNLEASKTLLEKSLEIVNNELKERDY